MSCGASNVTGVAACLCERLMAARKEAHARQEGDETPTAARTGAPTCRLDLLHRFVDVGGGNAKVPEALPEVVAVHTVVVGLKAGQKAAE